MSISHEDINDIQSPSLLDVSEVGNASNEIQIANKREKEEPYNNRFYDLLDELFCHLVSTNAIFKSQQIGDPDLTSDDKRKIGQELLKKSPPIFLLKFGPFLKLKHLDYFTPMNDQIQWSNELEFHLKNLLKMSDSKTSKVIKRNRRFGALKRLQQQGDYFSETEMEKREPLLYHQLVGQYLTEREKLERLCEDDDSKEPVISNVLLARAEREEVEALYKAQKEAEDACTEETDSSDENSNSQDTVLTNGDISSAQGKSIKRWGDDWTDVQNKKPKQSKNNEKNKKSLSSEEKELLFDEFRSIIYSKFLDGEDVNFDYSTVDTNPDYDCLEVCSQDAEEKYFDSEEVGQEDGEICTDTGIEDY